MFNCLWVRSLPLADTVTCDPVRGGGDTRPVFATIACPRIDYPPRVKRRFRFWTCATSTHLRFPRRVDAIIWCGIPPSQPKTTYQLTVASIFTPITLPSWIVPNAYRASRIGPTLQRLQQHCRRWSTTHNTVTIQLLFMASRSRDSISPTITSVSIGSYIIVLFSMKDHVDSRWIFMSNSSLTWLLSTHAITEQIVGISQLCFIHPLQYISHAHLLTDRIRTANATASPRR